MDEYYEDIDQSYDNINYGSSDGNLNHYYSEIDFLNNEKVFDINLLPKSLFEKSKAIKVSEIISNSLLILCNILNDAAQNSSKSDKSLKHLNYPIASMIKRKRANHKKKLDPTATGLLGQANVLISQKNFTDAMKLCNELIQSYPKFYEPVQTLAFIYKELNDTEKYLAYSLVYAHLIKNDSFLWGKMARKFFKLEQYQRSRICYEKSYRCSSLYIPVIWEYISICFSSGDYYTLVLILSRLLRCLDSEYFILVEEILKHFLNLFKLVSIENADFKLYHSILNLSNHIYPIKNPSILNFLMKYHVLSRNYYPAMRDFLRYFDLEPLLKIETISMDQIPQYSEQYEEENFDLSQTNIPNIFSHIENVNETTNVNKINDKLKCQVDNFGSLIEKIPFELIIYFFITLVSITDHNEILIQNILNYVISKFNDFINCNYPIAELEQLVQVLFSKNYYFQSLMLYEQIRTHSEQFAAVKQKDSKSAVELRPIDPNILKFIHVECLWKTFNDPNTIIIILLNFIELSSLKNFHPLFYILVAIFHYKLVNYNLFHFNMIKFFESYNYNQCYQKELLDFIKELLQELTEAFNDQEPNEYFLTFLFCQAILSKKIEEKAFMPAECFIQNIKRLFKSRSSNSDNLENQIFISKFVIFAVDYKKKDFFDYETRKLLTFYNVSYLTEIKQFELALKIFSNFIFKSINNETKININVWNFLNYVLQRTKIYLNKKSLPLASIFMSNKKTPEIENIRLIFKAHNNLSNRMNSSAFRTYHQIIKLNPLEANYFLLGGVSLINIACFKKSDCYGQLTIQGMAYVLRYFNIAGGQSNKEACYNLARCYHSLNLLTMAVKYYNIALEANEQNQELSFSLNFQTAHNLARIYTSSKNKEMAIAVKKLYCFI